MRVSAEINFSTQRVDQKVEFDFQVEFSIVANQRDFPLARFSSFRPAGSESFLHVAYLVSTYICIANAKAGLSDVYRTLIFCQSSNKDVRIKQKKRGNKNVFYLPWEKFGLILNADTLNDRTDCIVSLLSQLL